MLVAVTGGTGFIGSKLVERHLAAGDAVRVLTRMHACKDFFSADVELYEGDLKDDETDLRPFTCGLDVLYNCAGETKDKDAMHDLHVAGTQRLIEAASGEIRHWVQLSSVATYRPVNTGIVSEESPLGAAGAYSESKTHSDNKIIEASEGDAFSYTILRPSTVFGRDMNNQSLFRIISAINRGCFFFVGKEGAQANYIHVDDVAQGLILCGTRSEAINRVYNISASISMEKLIDVIATALGKAPPKIRLPEKPVRALSAIFGLIPGFPLSTSSINALTTRVTYTSKKIKQELDYRQCVPLESGLEELVENWRTGK